MDTLDNLGRKIVGAEQLKSVVRTMKALAASNIGQYEMAVRSLEGYFQTIKLGLVAYIKGERIDSINNPLTRSKNKRTPLAIIFGSDQGLVGQFNDSLVNFMVASHHELPSEMKIWSVGERIVSSLLNNKIESHQHFYVPNSVAAITTLVGRLLTSIEKETEEGDISEIRIFHNKPVSRTSYTPEDTRLLPLDEEWRREVSALEWPTKVIPEVVGGSRPTLNALLHEYFFASLFKACAESLASENASRLNAMQRAEKNIEDLLEDFTHQYHQIRQTSIDEELFDVVTGFETMKKENGNSF